MLDGYHTLGDRDISMRCAMVALLDHYATPHRLLFFGLAVACNITGRDCLLSKDQGRA